MNEPTHDPAGTVTETIDAAELVAGDEFQLTWNDETVTWTVTNTHPEVGEPPHAHRIAVGATDGIAWTWHYFNPSKRITARRHTCTEDCDPEIPGPGEDGIPDHLWSAHCDEGCCP